MQFSHITSDVSQTPSPDQPGPWSVVRCGMPCWEPEASEAGAGSGTGGLGGGRGIRSGPRAGGRDEQAGRAEPLAAGGRRSAAGSGWRAVRDSPAGSGLAAGREAPAGPGQQVLGLAGLEPGFYRLPHRRHRGFEAGPVHVAGATGHRHADGELAAGRGELAELDEDALQDRGLEVGGYPFEQEQAGHGRVEPSLPQPVSERVPGEVGLDERHSWRGDAEPFQPPELVPLGRGVVDLEPADVGPGVAQRAPVVAGRAGHDLPHAPVDGAGHGAVEERRAGREVVVHAARRYGEAVHDVDGQRLVGGGIAVAGGDPVEREAVRGHPAGSGRRTPVFHTGLFWHGVSVASMATDSVHRAVRLERVENSSYIVTNDRGGQMRIGHGEGTDFTPVDLLLAGIGGCTAIDVDILTSRRAEPDSFEVAVDAEKIRDENGNHLSDIVVTFRVRFPEGEQGDKARALLPDAVKKSHERLCTVSRTVELGTPITDRIES